MISEVPLAAYQKSEPVGPLRWLWQVENLLVALTLAFYLSLLIFILAQRHGVLQHTSDPWDQPVIFLGAGSVLVALIGSAFCNYFYGLNFPIWYLPGQQ